AVLEIEIETPSLHRLRLEAEDERVGVVIELFRFALARGLARRYRLLLHLDVPVGVAVAGMGRETVIEVEVAFNCGRGPPIFRRLEIEPVRHGNRWHGCRHLGNLVEDVRSIDAEGLDTETVRYSQPRVHLIGRGEIADRIRSLGISRYRDGVRCDLPVR